MDYSIVTGEDVMQFLVDGFDVNGAAVVKCQLCGKYSKQKVNMRRHMILIHTKPTNDMCKYCQKVFKHKYYLDRHIRSKECLSKMLFNAPSTSRFQ